MTLKLHPRTPPEVVAVLSDRERLAELLATRTQDEVCEFVGCGHISLRKAMDEALTRGVLEKDERLVRWGSKYKRARYRNGEQDLVVELFVAQRHTWGYVLALRTGPADFNKIWASHEYHGGCLPLGYRLRDGELWHHGEVVPVEEEEAFFEAIGLPWWPPAERTAERLTAWLKERR